MVPLLIVAIRLFVPFSILRWPFWGMLAAIAADASDVIIADALGWGFGSAERYHAFDKIFDLYYLAIALFAALEWPEAPLRRTALTLFGWRAAGVAALEATGLRQVMFFAPNIFENFYLLVVGAKTFAPRLRVDNWRRIAILLAIAGIPKVIQEYVMHFIEFPTWLFFKRYLLWWLF